MIAGLAVFEPLRSRWLAAAPAAWIDEADALAVARGLRAGSGARLRFRPEPAGTAGGAPGGAGAYERRIWTEGVVGCRTGGAGAAHDLHNALAWLSLPATKAALNAIHVRALARADAAGGAGRARSTPPGHRPRVRDFATLLDESGLLWVSRSADCDRALLAHDWSRLFVDRRAQLESSVFALVLGHGLLHKLAKPYKSITAHCLLLDARAIPGAGGAHAAPATGLPALPSGTPAAIAAIDRAAAAALHGLGGDAARAPPALQPLPVMGLPGWHPDNRDPAFFHDTRVFRPPRGHG
ncbi:MAG: DUF3025 domain-containing protein [Lautropia sp.]